MAATSRSAFQNPFTGERAIGASIAYMTDGTWLWLDDLPDYIDHHDLAIPTAMLAHIQSVGYMPPESVPIKEIERLAVKLEWPPIQSHLRKEDEEGK